MSYPLVPAIAVLTSLVVIAFAVVTLRRPLAGLIGAAGMTLEVIGTVVCFVVANLLVGAALVLVLRRWTAHYLSLYEVSDLTLLGLSFLQALTFYAWRARRE
jgi:hypothetical protein